MFAKLQKVTISFIMSAHLSVRPYGKTRLPLDGFLRYFMLSVFENLLKKIQVLIKSNKNKGYFT